MSRRSPLVAAALFAALTGLVAAGSLTRVDQWAVHHAMPNARHRHATVADALVPLLHANWHSALDVATGVVAAPASVVVSLLVVVALRRRRWLLLWLAVNAAEELCKAALTRPALYAHGVHLTGFDSSFPSGHSARAVLVGVAVATIWPATRMLAAAWLAALVVLLELDGWHTPADIAGGLLLAAAALGLLRRRAA